MMVRYATLTKREPNNNVKLIEWKLNEFEKKSRVAKNEKIGEQEQLNEPPTRKRNKQHWHKIQAKKYVYVGYASQTIHIKAYIIFFISPALTISHALNVSSTILYASKEKWKKSYYCCCIRFERIVIILWALLLTEKNRRSQIEIRDWEKKGQILWYRKSKNVYKK